MLFSLIMLNFLQKKTYAASAKRMVASCFFNCTLDIEPLTFEQGPILEWTFEVWQGSFCEKSKNFQKQKNGTLNRSESNYFFR